MTEKRKRLTSGGGFIENPRHTTNPSELRKFGINSKLQGQRSLKSINQRSVMTLNNINALQSINAAQKRNPAFSMGK